MVRKAREFARKAHAGQVRKFSGAPYYSHPKHVARVIRQLTRDPTLTTVALLHDTVEDTKTSFQDIEDNFGCSVSNMVRELTIDRGDPLYEKGKDHYLAQKLPTMSDGSLVVKLADRFHNILTLEHDDVDITFKKRYWNETKKILGILVEKRKLNVVQNAIVDRINAILKFLEIRHGW